MADSQQRPLGRTATGAGILHSSSIWFFLAVFYIAYFFFSTTSSTAFVLRELLGKIICHVDEVLEFY